MTHPRHIARFLAFLCLIQLAVGPARARASACPPAEPSGAIEVPASVLAGDLIELRWAGVRGAVAEVELLLSLDGGVTYPVRLTREIEGHSLRFLWRVPDLPASRARLLLRVGDETGERTGAVSRLFAILHAEGAPAPDLVYHEGTLWSGPGSATAAAHAAFAPPRTRFESAAASTPAGSPVPQAPRVEPASAAVIRLCPVARDECTAPCSDASAPREITLRI